MQQASPPRLDPAWVYLFDVAETIFVDGQEMSPTAIFIHQAQSTWSQEFIDTFHLVSARQVQDLLTTAYERGIAVTAVPKQEFFSRLLQQTAPQHATN